MADGYNLAQMGTLSEDEFTKQQQLNRQQQLAQLLMQQGQKQPQGQMIGNRYVAPSFFQYAAPLFQTYAGMEIGKKADTEAAKLAQEIRKNKGDVEQEIINKMIPQPARAEEIAGPAYRGVAPTIQYPEQAADFAGALKRIQMNPYGAGKEYIPSILKQMNPEPTPEERKYKAAVADGSWKPEKMGGFNAFMQQMSDKDKASLANEKIRIGIAQQELMFNTGMGMPGMGGGASVPQGAPQAPLQTINPGSPILAPGQQVAPQQGFMPQQGGVPRFNSKAEQDIYVATQKEAGRLQAEAQNALPGALLTAQSGITTINELIGDTSVDSKGKIVYGKQRPKAGFEAAVGMPSAGSLFGVTNLFPGSEAADFKAAFEQVGGQAFLGAISTLKGSGAISEAEGSKATSAVTRMKLSQSEPEFIKAANDFRTVLEKGYKAAQQRAGAAPINPTAPPSIGGAAKPKYVWDPVTGTLK
jgi:hypothetical protein